MNKNYTQTDLHLIHELTIHADELAKLDHKEFGIPNLEVSWQMAKFHFEANFPGLSDNEMLNLEEAFAQRYNKTFIGL